MLTTTWPPQQTLFDFTMKAANILIPVLVGDYFDALQQDFGKTSDSINSLATSTAATLNGLNGLLADFNATAVIDSNFIMYAESH